MQGRVLCRRVRGLRPAELRRGNGTQVPSKRDAGAGWLTSECSAARSTNAAAATAVTATAAFGGAQAAHRQRRQWKRRAEEPEGPLVLGLSDPSAAVSFSLLALSGPVRCTVIPDRDPRRPSARRPLPPRGRTEERDSGSLSLDFQSEPQLQEKQRQLHGLWGKSSSAVEHPRRKVGGELHGPAHPTGQDAFRRLRRLQEAETTPRQQQFSTETPEIRQRRGLLQGDTVTAGEE
ncbi:hypothetical protein NDU88_006887 [Pleurodeles waltl]|uniref:Uncharacterized protein n=1 Tax=Pleurodeles waltl TaxID=8319 RepID=A0AAV7LQG5_PLEWA|nr:hypothetical protein NDU88_006887 [Pleurodeles waltl]